MGNGLILTPFDFYSYVRESKSTVLSNIIFNGSPGHQILELDYFLRKFHRGDVPRDGKYLWVQAPTPITTTMAEVFGPHFRKFNLGMIANAPMFQMASEITQMVPELGIDVGLSHLKNAVVSRAGKRLAAMGNDLYYSITNDAVIQDHIDYFGLRGETMEFDPWSAAYPAIDGPLADLLGGGIDRYAVVHFRSNTGNAGVAIPVDAMFSALEYLRDCGFTIVQGGTEKCPEEFRRYGVIRYSESDLRNFKNDLALLAHCKVALINASGLENIGDLINVPTVSYARWHLTLGPFSSRTVIVPSLLFDPERQRLLTLGEQILFFKTRQEWGEGRFFGWAFPLDRFIARNPQADEMRAAVQEAVENAERLPPESPLQARVRKLDENGLMAVRQSRISQFFLERFQSLV